MHDADMPTGKVSTDLMKLKLEVFLSVQPRMSGVTALRFNALNDFGREFCLELGLLEINITLVERWSLALPERCSLALAENLTSDLRSVVTTR